MTIYRLTCTTRDYAWGSATLLPRFLDEAPTGLPQAELWIGAHPLSPSVLPDGRTLDALVAGEPAATLGERTQTKFGPRLPFLMKALAAAEPLSLQVHPTSERARIGFAEEEAAGLPVDAPDRNYRDPFHKPELVLAVTRFEGMAGFRDVDKTAEILGLLGTPWAEETAHRLVSAPAFQALRGVVTDILGLEPPALAAALADLRVAAREAEERSHQVRRPATRVNVERSAVDREAIRVFAQTVSLADRYPEDPGVLVTLLLNHVVLAPGEAMFLGAGVVHAYTSGFGIEIMASSDNVVRAGLTPKHVDVHELLHIASFTPIPPPLWVPTALDEGGQCFDPPVDEFALVVGTAPLTSAAPDGPRIVLALEGSVTVRAGGAEETLDRGAAVFVPHDAGPLHVEGSGRVAIGAVPA
ncbi:mannose-6-phosphate isomerase, class I [Nocardioides sp.]|uniref:mannose-6-phosphate isomerase, class I n=1 Tax=Nocardioides sp. TaxID=35761 RepID=UPI0025FA5387|nr:mannose-6-phosphate isomerase, class I [Nocardioides sp.]